jgi:hypothetical protein
MARPRSCRAAATISAADAEPPFISTTICTSAALGRKDGAIADEQLRDRLRLVEQAAAVGAHVDDDAGHVAADLAARLVDGRPQIVGGGAVEAGQVDQGDVAAPLVGDRGRDDAAALDAERQLGALRGAQHAEHDRCTDRAAQGADDVVQRALDHRHAVDRQDLVADLDAALRGGRPRLHGTDQDLPVVGPFDGDADAAAAVALEAIVARLVGIGIAGVAVELLGGGGHGVVDQHLAVGLLQHRRGRHRACHQLGQHGAPRPAVGRIGRRRPAHHRAAVALDREGAVRRLERERRVGAGKAAVGLGRQVAEIGLEQVAVADRAIGLQHNPFDIDVGGDSRVAALRLGRFGGGRTGDDQRGGKQGTCRTRQRRTKQTNKRHFFFYPRRRQQ